MSTCPRCDRPEATPEQWKGPTAHDDGDGGCECAECCATCWGACTPKDWRAECLRLRQERDEALGIFEGPSTLKDLAAIAHERGCRIAELEKDQAELAEARELLFGVVNGYWSADHLRRSIRAYLNRGAEKEKS